MKKQSNKIKAKPAIDHRISAPENLYAAYLKADDLVFEYSEPRTDRDDEFTQRITAAFGDPKQRAEVFHDSVKRARTFHRALGEWLVKNPQLKSVENVREWWATSHKSIEQLNEILTQLEASEYEAKATAKTAYRLMRFAIWDGGLARVLYEFNETCR